MEKATGTGRLGADATARWWFPEAVGAEAIGKRNDATPYSAADFRIGRSDISTFVKTSGCKSRPARAAAHCLSSRPTLAVGQSARLVGRAEAEATEHRVLGLVLA